MASRNCLADVIDMPIGRDRYVREKQAVRKIENGGREAVTIYEVERVFEAASEKSLKPSLFPTDRKLPVPPSEFSLVQLIAQNGENASVAGSPGAIGFPIVGDTMYGGRIYESEGFRFERQALHAHEITFVHPGTLEEMTLTAPLPADMRKLIGRSGESGFQNVNRLKIGRLKANSSSIFIGLFSFRPDWPYNIMRSRSF